MRVSRFEILLKAMECGSFSRTAEYFSYTQSAVSQLVKAMEKEFGVTIFQRNASALCLTDEGKYLLPAMRELVAGERALADGIAQLQNLQAGIVRTAVYTSLSCHFLPAHLKRFKETYPNVRFELLQGDFDQVAEWVRTGAADIGLMSDPGDKAVEFTPLMRDRMMVIFPEGHPLAGAGTVALPQLAEERFILLESSSGQLVGEMVGRVGQAVDVPYRVKDDYTILSMVENGLGISILPELVLRRTPYRVKMALTDPPFYRELGIARRKRTPVSWAVRCFERLLMEQAAEGGAGSQTQEKLGK